MRMVIQIAKAELRNLFYSPVAWFLGIAFMVLFAWSYTSLLVIVAQIQQAMSETNPDFKDWGAYPLTYAFFTPPNGSLKLVLDNLFLFVPLLTMGLIGRETQAGTIKLLYSSPVSLRKIVGGKFLAIMIYNLVLVTVAGLFMLSFALCVKSPDLGLILASVFSLFLLTCAFTSVGLFVSSLTNYQIVAAIGTFLIVFILARIGGVWQKYDFLRDLTYFLHLPSHTSRMIKGLVASKDVIYYIMIVFMFLGFTLIRLRSMRESKPWYIKVMRVSLIIGITLGVGYIFSLPETTIYEDLTEPQANTIHPNMQKVVGELNEAPLEVTLYVNLLGGSAIFGFPENRNEYLSMVWEKVQRFKTDISFRYVYYYYYEPELDNGVLEHQFPGKSNEEMAREMAKGYKVNFNKFMPVEEINKQVNLAPEGHRLLMQLRYKGRTEFLRTYNSSVAEGVWPSDENMTAAFKRLAHPESIPLVLYTSDNLERSIRRVGEREFHYSVSKQFGSSVVNLGFDTDTISLEKQEIPANTSILVVADPKTEFSETVFSKIKKYMDDGGNIVFMSEPGKQQLLNPLISQLGVKILDGNLVEPTYNEMPQMVKPYYTRNAPSLAEETMLWVVKEKWKMEYFKDTAKMLMPGVAALSYSDSNGFTKKPLLLTVGSNTWIKKGKLVVDSAEVVYNPKEGDIRGAFPTVLQLTRQIGNKQQRVAVYGDADFMSNSRLSNGEEINRAVFSWMTGNEYPVYLLRAYPKDNLLLIKPGIAKVIHVAGVYILPSLLLITAITILIRRKRK